MNNSENKIKNNIYINIDGILCYYNISTYKEINSIDYFSELKPNIAFIEALKNFAINHTVRIYLIVPYFPNMKHCLTERKHWINDNIPFILKKHIVYVPVGQVLYDSINIEQFISTDNLYLIDDYIPNLRRWEMKNENMKGILFSNNDIKSDSNSSIQKQWENKPVLEHSTDKDNIYRQLKKLINI